MTASVVAFAGPSLPPDPDVRWPAIDLRPPAAAGDLIALLDAPPRVAVLIDGCFDAVAAVGHKELLALAAAGTRVVGAASMGALRAAELDRHGMIGVGGVYRAFRAGRLSGDDEVALLHAPAAFGWRPMTVAMVDLRAALSAGRRRRWWGGEEARRCRVALHAVHFADRDPHTVATVADGCGVEGERLVALLDEPGVAIKQRDAVQALDLAAAGAFPPAGAIPPPPATCFLRALARRRGVALPRSTPASAPPRP